jgi:hypothetical protein
MEHLNKVYYISALVVISTAASLVCTFASGQSITSFPTLVQQIPNIVTCDAVVIAIFVKWGWRWRALYPWFVPFPDLNGLWSGELHSKWTDAAPGTPKPPIDVSLSITQTFIRISCVMQTSEMRSASTLAGFLLDDARQEKQLVYTYCSRPKLLVREGNPMHDGTTVFDIMGNPPSELVGEYWTSRGTAGEMKLRRRENRPKWNYRRES